jgi:triacylglycerol esterase/lipase EstA (alpha/beta hydrolase family)
MWSAIAAALLLVGGFVAYARNAPPAHDAFGVARLLVGGVLVYAGIIAALVGVYFALSWLWRAPRPRAARIGLRGTLQLVGGEYRALFFAPWRMLFYRWLMREGGRGRRFGAAAATPVLLVHGVLCNAGVWSRMARLLRRARITPVFALSYGPPLASIDRFAEQLHAKVESVCARTGAGDLVIVAHSMGGLVTLAYLRRHGTARVRRVVTLGTPWQGSRQARTFPGTSLRQLRPGNPWLEALDVRAPAGGPPMVSIWSWHDSMVTPQTSSVLPGATNVALTGIGHNALLGDRRVARRVIAEIAIAAAQAHAASHAAHTAAAADGAAAATARPDTCSEPGTLP